MIQAGVNHFSWNEIKPRKPNFVFQRKTLKITPLFIFTSKLNPCNPILNISQWCCLTIGLVGQNYTLWIIFICFLYEIFIVVREVCETDCWFARVAKEKLWMDFNFFCLRYVKFWLNFCNIDLPVRTRPHKLNDTFWSWTGKICLYNSIDA